MTPAPVLPAGSPAPTVPTWLQQLAAALPGVEAGQISRFVPPSGADRHSAVLILFAEGTRGPDVLLIERSHTMRSHAGQPAFPGGALDPEDGEPTGAGPVAAALREAREEVGLDPGSVEVLAALPPLWLPPSGFVVHPVVGLWRAPHPIRVVDEAEVAAVVRVGVAELADPANRVQVTHPSGWIGPGFNVHGLLVWGFTAGLLDALLDLAGWAVPWDRSRRQALDPELVALAARSTSGAPPAADALTGEAAAEGAAAGGPASG